MGILRGQTQIPSCCPSVMLSPPKPLDEIKPNYVCVSVCVTQMNGACNVKRYFGPASWGPGEGQKVKYHLISITKSISKIFIPNFVCVLTNERCKTYQTVIIFCRLGHALRWDLGVLRGQNQIPSCCLSVMLSPPILLEEIKPYLVCELLTWMGRAKFFFLPCPLGPWGGVKRSNII